MYSRAVSKTPVTYSMKVNKEQDIIYLSLLFHKCIYKWFETARQWNWKLELWMRYISTYSTMSVNHRVCIKATLTTHFKFLKKRCFCFYLFDKETVKSFQMSYTHTPAWESLTLRNSCECCSQVERGGVKKDRVKERGSAGQIDTKQWHFGHAVYWVIY